MSNKNMNESTNTVVSEIVPDEFTTVLAQLDSMKKEMAQVITVVKQLQKKHRKHKRNYNVKSGFVKPVRISKSLAALIESKENELVARSVVNKKLNEYIKQHDLQVAENRQTFRLDNPLADLFNLAAGDVVHYFKMQTYLKHHYPKDVVETKAVPV